jgi:biopolymer transport protein TolR
MGAQMPDAGGHDRPMMAEINVTPFVDVMLVLLVIFMVTAPMMVTGVPVDLPAVDAPPLDAPDQDLVLSITADGTLYLNETEFTLEQITAKLTAIVLEKPGSAVYVKADGSVPYRQVAGVIAAARQAGIPKVGLVTRPSELD